MNADDSAAKVISRPLPLSSHEEGAFRSANEIYRFEVSLEAGDYIHVEVEQRGIDLAVSLTDSSDRLLFSVDSPGGAYSTERLAFVAMRKGEFRVALRPPENLRGRRFSIRTTALRPATERDKDYSRTCQELAVGEQHRIRKEPSLDKARLHYEKARAGWRRLGEPIQEAITLNRIGQIWERLGDYSQEVKHYEQALDLLDQVGHKDSSAEVSAHQVDLSLRSVAAYSRLGRADEARAANERARTLARQLGDLSSETTAVNNLALQAKIRGEFEDALEHFRRARDAYRDLGRTDAIAPVAQNIGQTYVVLGRMQDAVDAFQEAIGLSRSVGDEYTLSRALAGLGWARHLTGDSENALELFESAIGIARRRTYSIALVVALEGQGRTLFDLGQIEAARHSFLEALELTAGDRPSLARSHLLIHLSRLALRSGNPVTALEHAKAALEQLRRTGDLDAEVYALFALAQAERQLGIADAARTHIEQALSHVESVRAGAQSLALRQYLLEPRQNLYEFHVDLLMEMASERADERFVALAFSAAERARARLLLDLLTEARAEIRRGVSPALRQQEKEITRALAEQENLRMEAIAGGAPAALQERIELEQRAIIRRWEDLRTKILVESPRYSALTQPQTLDLRQVQKEVLDADTVLLGYWLGPEKSFLWRVTVNEIEHYELPPRAEIDALALRFHKAMEASHQYSKRGPARYLASELSRMILDPVRDDLGTTSLLIVGAGGLHYVPFAALPGPGGGPPLVVDHEIITLPSVSVLSMLTSGSSEPTTSWRVAVVADPVFEPDDERLSGVDVSPSTNPASSANALRGPERDPAFDYYRRLPHTRAEAQAILSLIPENRSFRALDFEASREVVTSGKLADYEIVHFATHGLLNTERPELSGLVLSLVDRRGQRQNAGYLRLYDIYNMDVRAELVVLSACRTALGKEIRGEGVVGLTRGFMYAGSSRVMVSLWSISDVATAKLMEHFYRALLQDGERPAQALRTAQRSMLEDPRFADPYYWASFVLQGTWR